MVDELEEVDKMEEATRFANEKFDRYCRFCEHYKEGEGTDHEPCYTCTPSNLVEEDTEKPRVGVEAVSPDEDGVIVYGVIVSGVNKDDEITVNIDSLVRQYNDGYYEDMDIEEGVSSE